ncbi:MAG: fasciclin domain-containing protein, partial [Flavobacteriaceae bacterium]|nr:fasciclin domain-containing protein [Flavobacteriaceae bacterium]
MKFISQFTKIMPFIMLLFVLQACSNDDDGSTPQPEELTIVETAQASANLSILVSALQAADGDLVSVLSGDGPFTVLAPTNAAFTQFLADNNFNSLDDVPTDVLAQVLLNHVIAGEVTSTDLTAAGSGYTSTSATGPNNNNLSLYFDTSSGVEFNGVSGVTQADIEASNGI